MQTLKKENVRLQSLLKRVRLSKPSNSAHSPAKLRMAKKTKTQKKKEEEGEDIYGARDFTLDEDPHRFFFDMFANHVYTGDLLYGDLYRIFKFYKIFSTWDVQ